MSEDAQTSHLNYINKFATLICKCGSKGGNRGADPPPGKSQVIWVSIGNKQFDNLCVWGGGGGGEGARVCFADFFI